MDEELQLLYAVKDEFDEVRHRYRENQRLGNVYSFSGGISENILTGREGSIELEGTDETLEYTLDQVRGKPLLRMTHTFEEIDKALSSDGCF